MTRPQPDDDRIVELNDDDDWDPEPVSDDWRNETGTAAAEDRLLLDEVPPHWG